MNDIIEYFLVKITELKSGLEEPDNDIGSLLAIMTGVSLQVKYRKVVTSEHIM